MPSWTREQTPRLAKCAFRGLSQPQQDLSRAVSVPSVRFLRSEPRYVSCVRLASSHMPGRGLARCAGLACMLQKENAWTVRSVPFHQQELLCAPHVPPGLSPMPLQPVAMFVLLDLTRWGWGRTPMTTLTMAMACLASVLSAPTPFPVARRNVWSRREPVLPVRSGTTMSIFARIRHRVSSPPFLGQPLSTHAQRGRFPPKDPLCALNVPPVPSRQWVLLLALYVLTGASPIRLVWDLAPCAVLATTQRVVAGL